MKKDYGERVSEIVILTRNMFLGEPDVLSWIQV